MSFTSILFTIVLVAISTILWMLWKLTYWSRHGIKSIKPSLLFGNFGPTFLLKKSFGVQASKLYNQTTEPYIGAYILLRPTIIVRDVDLVRTILIKDFQHFVSRGFHVDESYDPVSGNLFVIDDPIKWKKIRQKLTPAFTSAKLKTMCQLMIDGGSLVEKYLLSHYANGSVVEMNEIAAQYTTNFIISMTYGLEIDCFNNAKDKLFHDVGKRILGPSWKSTFRILLKWLAHSISSITRLQIIDPEVKTFLFNLFDKTIKYREENNVRREDFLQVFVDMKHAKQMDEAAKPFTKNELAAQGIIIFVAGYDTSSIAISHSLYEIAKNQTIQHTIHEEIDRVLAAHGGVLSYDSLSEMKFLDSCIDETLRMYPSLPMLNRQCSKDYTLPDGKFTITKGTSIVIPILALHTDSQYFPEPQTYNPYRFYEKENFKNSVPYFPFGDGPRNCIGLRMAKLVVKIGLIKMLSQFRYEVEMDTSKPLEFAALNVTLFPGNGIHLRINKRFN